MTNPTLNIGFLCVVLAGCSGGSFGGSAATDGGGSAGGDRGTGDAGDASGGTPASGGSGTGGRAKLGTGGAGTGGASPGTGGAAAGTGGGSAGTGGTGGAGGGAPGTGGVGPGTGGTVAGTGRDAGTCKPPVVDATNLPATLVWQSYLSKYGTTCLTCTHSPCATCTIEWFPVTQSADGLTVTASLNKSTCGMVAVSMGACGSDPALGQCTTWNPSVEATLVLHLEAKSDGSGYRVASVSGEQGHVAAVAGTCPSVAFGEANSTLPPSGVLAGVQAAAMAAVQWPCGR